MFAAEIPPANLDHLPMFGWFPVGDGDGFRLYENRDGECMIVNLTRPLVYVEDQSDAMQLGATSIKQIP